MADGRVRVEQIHTYIHLLSFFQFHTAILLAKYRTRTYNTIFTLQHDILKEI